MKELEVFGANVYLHDEGEQRAVLAHAVLPWAGPLFASGDLPFFLYDHYDARGPHLSLFFAAPAPRRPALAEALARCLERALAAAEERGVQQPLLTPGQLETRHAACRGRVQNPADREEGFPPPGSFLPFLQEFARSPFRLGAATADGDAFLALWRELCRATAARMGADPRPDWRGAVVLVATLGRALAAEGKHPGVLFRRDAAALLPNLAGRLEKDGETAAFASVARLVTARNAAAFTGWWRDELPGALAPAALRALVRAAVGNGGGAWDDDHPAVPPLRELLHFSLKGLGLQGIQQIPLVLHAWRQWLPGGPEETKTFGIETCPSCWSSS